MLVVDQGLFGVPVWAYGALVAAILVMLAVDLFVFHREAHAVSAKEAAVWTVVWVVSGLTFGGIVWTWLGGDAAGQYLAGYLIEKSLAVDNIFVFAVLFTYFGVPLKYQHRVLYWGILGALIFRGVFIAGGALLLRRFSWMIYVFGGFLLYTAWKLYSERDATYDPGHNPVVRLFRRFVPMTEGFRGQRFFVREAGRLLATPMLAVLVAIEVSDVIFAIDSIPAIFAVTSEPFLVFSSNAFAILGLRAMYFLLADLIERFHRLRVGLSAVLAFVGVKMLLSEVYHIPTAVSLGVIGVLLGASVWASVRFPARVGSSESRPPDSP